MKSKRIFVLLFIMVVLIGLVIMIKTNYDKNQTYQKIAMNNTAYIIEAIIKNHPELEKEIIKNILTNPSNENGIKILEKYGLDEDYIMSNYVTPNQTHMLIYDIILYILFVIMILMIYIIYFVREKRKINQINEHISNILNDKETLDIRDYREDDISKLKNDIYKITIRLKEEKEASLNEKKNLEEMLSDISHQIKTPLTSMYVINDLLLEGRMDKKKSKEFIMKNKIQLERIEWLVTTLLKMSRLDSGTVKLKKETVEVSTFIDKIIEPLKIPIELKNQKLVLEINSNINLNIDLNWTAEAFINILKNACEHAPYEGTIIIKTEDNPIYTSISITDNGEGIEEKDIKHIFERFYKVNQSKESIGIGLNMAKKIIEKQNGLIEVLSERNKYTTFKIKFYKIK